MFIANEWNELQTERLTSRAFTLTLMLLFLLGLDWQNMCVIEPTLATDDPKPYQVQSMLLRFALAAILMCVIVLCQVVYKFVWHHNYVEHPIQQFVDLLTMANMSIILLDDECSGYYLHGRSLMTFSDTSMQELMAQMRREEEMQVSGPGARALVAARGPRGTSASSCSSPRSLAGVREQALEVHRGDGGDARRGRVRGRAGGDFRRGPKGAEGTRRRRFRERRGMER